MTHTAKPAVIEADVDKESFEDASEQTPEKSQPESSEEHSEKSTEKSDTDADATTKEPDVEPGMDLTAKELYRRERYENWEEWQGAIPDDDNEKYKKHALVVRRERDCDGGGVLLHSVSVQSPYIREFLSKVFDGYRGVYTNLKRLVFRPPFQEFFYRWEQFNQLLAETTDELALKHIELLRGVIEPEIVPHLEAQDDLIKVGVITYEYLWALFPPDTEVYAQTESGERLYIARRCWYRKNVRSTTFIVDCEYIDFDGTILGYGTDKLEIDQFGGHQKISEINPVPTAFLPNLQDVRRRLTDRGRAFEKLMGVHYKGYTGLWLPNIPSAFLKPRRRYIEKGRIVIDAKLFHEQDPDRKPRIRPLGSEIKEKEKSDDDYDYYERAIDDVDDYGESHTQPGRLMLNEDEYCYCSAFVRGYNLTSKQWAEFEAANVTEVALSHNAFDKLVLPFDYKELILAFAESQLSHKDKFDDIIAGKGQGIIMLLSGEPGVGKTLTAEAVSEQMKCPLYSMSAGELGSDAAEVEANLEKVLEISAKWDAVLLLDECDVFLEQRTLTDIHRNKLVSVFLRLLEYYKGVMFLTTNRVSTFDAAFQSRIHLTINYPSLDQSSRGMIWRTFVHPEGVDLQHKSTITNTELNELAEMKLNGREIKNIVKTARLLANRKNIGLGLGHVKTVLRIKQDSVSNSILTEDD